MIVTITPKAAYEKLKNGVQSNEHRNSLEKIIATNGLESFFYAANILNRRFRMGEPAILKSGALNAIEYAKMVIRGRWKEAEPIILSDQKYAIRYLNMLHSLNMIPQERFDDDTEEAVIDLKSIINNNRRNN